MFRKTPKNVYQLYHSKLQIKLGNRKTPNQTGHLISLAQISTNSETAYIRPEEVRKNLAKAGFELWENISKGGRILWD